MGLFCVQINFIPSSNKCKPRRKLSEEVDQLSASVSADGSSGCSSQIEHSFCFTYNLHILYWLESTQQHDCLKKETIREVAHWTAMQ